ncbi:hypothetical protein ADUPG1_005117, partial [Aduncisulcus paluster]
MSRVGHEQHTIKILSIDDSLFEEIKLAQSKDFSPAESKTYQEDEGYRRDKQYRIVIPESSKDLHRKTFEMFHSATSGHHGAAHTQFKIQQSGISWNSIASDCKKWTES